jgi:Kdo2-lipid IVA lauroyltransferase/acyltransferase
MPKKRTSLRRKFWKKARPLRHLTVHLTLKVVSYCIIVLGPRLARRVCSRLALLAIRLFPSERRKILKNIEFAYADELSEAQREKIFKAMVRNLGMMAADSAFLATGREDKIACHIRVENGELYRNKPEDKGLLFITAHYGLWELMPKVLKPYNPSPAAVVAREIANPYFEATLNDTRKRIGVNILTRGKSGREYIRFLRKGGSLAVMGDIDTRKGDGLFVEFFGQPAWTQRGIARLAKTGRSLVYVGFIERDLDNPDQHVVRFGPEIPLPDSSDRVEWEEQLTQAYTHEIERAVRRRPDQWMWMHRRWRTQPDDPQAWRKEWEAKGLAGKAPRPEPDPRLFEN